MITALKVLSKRAKHRKQGVAEKSESPGKWEFPKFSASEHKQCTFKWGAEGIVTVR